MNRFVSILAVFLLSAALSYSQFQIPEIDKVKEIKLLESTAFDVQRIMVGFETDGWNPGDLEQQFSTDNFSIDITYSSGECSKDDDEIWDAKQWTVTEIIIEPNEPLKIKDLGFDFSKFIQEQVYANQSELFVYHDKTKGLAYRVDKENGDVRSITILPPKNSKVGICNNDKAKEFISSESWFGKTKLKDRVYWEESGAASVTDLILNNAELDNLSAKKQIQVKAVAFDAENDVLTYQYTVSAGTIIGKGPEVIWDLSFLPAGTYTITAGVDDGCGVCGKTVTKTVVIK
jgi:hypothetical protein